MSSERAAVVAESVILKKIIITRFFCVFDPVLSILGLSGLIRACAVMN